VTVLEFTAYADAPYHILVDTYAGMESTYSLDVQCQ
jgi:hypothetical protein